MSKIAPGSQIVPAAQEVLGMDQSNTPDIVPLTRTERKCLEYVAQGWNDKQIGRALTLTEAEVATVLNVAIRKLRTSNRMAAIAKATRLGLLEV